MKIKKNVYIDNVETTAHKKRKYTRYDKSLKDAAVADLVKIMDILEARKPPEALTRMVGLKYGLKSQTVRYAYTNYLCFQETEIRKRRLFNTIKVSNVNGAFRTYDCEVPDLKKQCEFLFEYIFTNIGLSDLYLKYKIYATRLQMVLTDLDAFGLLYDRELVEKDGKNIATTYEFQAIKDESVMGNIRKAVYYARHSEKVQRQHYSNGTLTDELIQKYTYVLNYVGDFLWKNIQGTELAKIPNRYLSHSYFFTQPNYSYITYKNGQELIHSKVHMPSKRQSYWAQLVDDAGMFLYTLLERKTVDEIREMYPKLFEEYEDNPYLKINKICNGGYMSRSRSATWNLFSYDGYGPDHVFDAFKYYIGKNIKTNRYSSNIQIKYCDTIYQPIIVEFIKSIMKLLEFADKSNKFIDIRERVPNFLENFDIMG